MWFSVWLGVWSARPGPKVKGSLRGRGGPCGSDKTDVYSTAPGGASSGLPPAFVCGRILPPQLAPSPDSFLTMSLALTWVYEATTQAGASPDAASIG